ncbi:hypothetical protein HGI30_20950 [Paenibacillus albicereus]|uniref:Uncharacterized protein n=1 Tax=Paenibacillus albicereus TaxID=2726185 RepID=A0A6H2H222_9BACL|nr:hypothetical protein [Paenibacillus albicereus]QJC53744.1 hypothetical protein HGI30_20950 [Paenibacillus albicereus]
MEVYQVLTLMFMSGMFLLLALLTRIGGLFGGQTMNGQEAAALEAETISRRSRCSNTGASFYL